MNPPRGIRTRRHGRILAATCGMGVIAVMAGSVAGASVASRMHGAPSEHHTSSTGPIGDAAADVVHNPPLLYEDGEKIPFIFDLVCPGRPCGVASARFSYWVSGGEPLQIDTKSDSGHFEFSLPDDASDAPRINYSATFTLGDGRMVRYPSEGGTMTAESADEATPVNVGTAAFSAAEQVKGTRVVTGPWGRGEGEFGVNAQLSGPSSFDIDPTTGDVVVLDQVNARIVRVSPDGHWSSDSIALRQGVPDLAVSPVGNLDILYANAVAGATVEVFGPDGGEPLRSIPLASPAGNAIRRVGDRVLVEGDDSNWMTISSEGDPSSIDSQVSSALAGVSLEGHLVLRKNMRDRGNEVRVADSGPEGVHAWAITGDTALGPVLVAAPLDERRVVEVQAQFDNKQTQYTVLTLGSGDPRTFTTGQSLYAGLYDPSEFRLNGTNLYQVRSTQAGYAVYRYEL